MRKESGMCVHDCHAILFGFCVILRLVKKGIGAMVPPKGQMDSVLRHTLCVAYFLESKSLLGNTMTAAGHQLAKQERC